MWEGWKKLESWVEINVLCIVDQDHQWLEVAVGHTSKFKAMWLMTKQQLMVYNTDNRGEPGFRNYQKNHKFWGKDSDIILVGNWEKGK